MPLAVTVLVIAGHETIRQGTKNLILRQGWSMDPAPEEGGEPKVKIILYYRENVCSVRSRSAWLKPYHMLWLSRMKQYLVMSSRLDGSWSKWTATRRFWQSAAENTPICQVKHRHATLCSSTYMQTLRVRNVCSTKKGECIKMKRRERRIWQKKTGRRTRNNASLSAYSSS
jgi:hypothetical protein